MVAASAVAASTHAMGGILEADDITDDIAEQLNTLGISVSYNAKFTQVYGSNRKGDLTVAAWKAHVGASSETAIDVLKRVCPFLMENHISFKVDMRPKFDGNNKFITIYSPADDDFWESIIETLNVLLGDVKGNLIVPGEIAVGKKDLVHMRHGQPDALDIGGIAHNNIAFSTVDKTNRVYRLLNPLQFDGTIANGIVAYSSISGTLMATSTLTGKSDPVYIHEGKVYLDLRNHPNPLGILLPKGLVKR